MPWFYVDDGFSDSKPVHNMPDRYRLAACGLWTLAGSWSAKEELDGFVPDSKLKSLGARPPIIAALTDPGPLSAALCTQVSGGIQFNSWEKWQKTRAELNEKRVQDAERQRKWREEHPDETPPRKVKGRNAVTSAKPDVSQRDSGVTNGVTPTVTNAVTDALVTTDASRAGARGPNPTQPNPSSSGQFGEGTHVSSDRPPPPCSDHPGGWDHDEPCRKCGRLREYDESQTEIRERENRSRAHRDRMAKEAAIASCRLCDPQGQINMPDIFTDGHHPAQCPHDVDEIERSRKEILDTRAELANK